MESAAIQKELLDLKHLLEQKSWPHDQTIAVLILASSDILLLIEYTENNAAYLASKRTVLALVNQVLQQLDVIYEYLTTNQDVNQDLLTHINLKLLQAIDILLLPYQ